MPDLDDDYIKEASEENVDINSAEKSLNLLDIRNTDRRNTNAPPDAVAARLSDILNRQVLPDLRIQERQPRELSHRPDPAETIMRAMITELQVTKAISQLPLKLQKEFLSLQGNKDGTYSQEQLWFIKVNCPKEIYGAAREYNQARQLLNLFNIERPPVGHPIPGTPPDVERSPVGHGMPGAPAADGPVERPSVGHGMPAAPAADGPVERPSVGHGMPGAPAADGPVERPSVGHGMPGAPAADGPVERPSVGHGMPAAPAADGPVERPSVGHGMPAAPRRMVLWKDLQ